MFPAFLTTFLFSASAIVGNKSARMIGGIAANFYRILVAAALLATWAHLAGNGLHGKALPMFVLSGVIGFGIGDLALYQALPRIGSRLSVVIVHCLAAPFAAALEWLWLGTTLNTIQIFCSLTILAGVALALAPTENLSSTKQKIIWGISAAIVAAVCQGLGSVFSRKAYLIAQLAGESIEGITAGVTAAYQRICGGLPVVAATFLIVRLHKARSPRVHGAPERSQKGAWKLVFLNGLAGPGLGVVCYQWALASTPTGIVMPIVALTPLVIIPFARIFENEKPTPHSLFGGVLAVIGVIGLKLSAGVHP
jgi:drug/metabolite transporter (DMT)-like permease